MGRRQDHDRTVREARENMARADQRKPLERWIQNYVRPDTVIPEGQWCVVTKEKGGWKIELGKAESTTPYWTLMADAHAPQPPVMEIRPPKPEPVKPRFNVPAPRPVDSFDRMRAAMDAALNNALLHGTGTTNVTAADVEGITLEKMRAMLDGLPPDWRGDWRGPVRRPLYEPVHIGIDYGERSRYTAAIQYLALLPPPPIPESTLRYLREMSIDLPDPPLPPPPGSSKRNQ